MSLYLKILFRNLRLFSLSRIMNTLVYFVIRPFISVFKLKRIPYLPVSVFIWVTTRCSKSCAFCPYVQELNTNASNDDLSLAEFKNLFLESEYLKRNFHLAFYGGEPFLNKDLFLMINEAKQRGQLVTTTTNGLHIKQRLTELMASPPDFLTVSFYPEDLERLKENLPLIPRSIVRRLNFILSTQSLPFVERALELAMEYDFDYFSIDPISDKSRQNNELIFSDSDQFLSMKNRLNTLSKNSRIRIKFPNTLKSRYANTPGCFFAWDTIYMLKNKHWAPCCEWPLPDYQSSSDQNWNGAWLQARRDDLLKGVKSCGPCDQCTYRYDSTMGV